MTIRENCGDGREAEVRGRSSLTVLPKIRCRAVVPFGKRERKDDRVPSKSARMSRSFL